MFDAKDQMAAEAEDAALLYNALQGLLAHVKATPPPESEHTTLFEDVLFATIASAVTTYVHTVAAEYIAALFVVQRKEANKRAELVAGDNHNAV